MSLSKVYRNLEPGALKRVRFQEPSKPQGEFCEWSWGGEAETAFRPAEAPPQARPASSSPPPASADLARQLEEARARGRQEGLKEAEERFGKSSEMLARGLEEISRLRESLLRTSSHDMLRLVMTIARQVLHAEVSVRKETVLGTIERALQAAVQSDSYHLKVHPQDLERVTAHKPLLMASISGLQNVTVEADPEVSPGGCRVESEFGDVDATVEGQLEEIRRALLSTIEEG